MCSSVLGQVSGGLQAPANGELARRVHPPGTEAKKKEDNDEHVYKKK
jgi:hypothetical protein